MPKLRRVAAVAAALLATAVLASACAVNSAVAPAPVTTETPKPKPVAPSPVRFGTLPTEDTLPLWVAEKKGLFAKAGLKVQIVPYQSAQERDAAFTAGAIDAFMGDIIAAAELQDAGFPARITTVMLGATPAEGRFGIVSKNGSGILTMKGLEGVPVGTSSGTIQEYVLDGLAAEAGLPPSAVQTEEVKKVPVRYELLINGNVKAAALPEPFLSLALKNNANLLADDTKGRNLSQTVLVASAKYLDTPGGHEAFKRLLGVWDQGVAAVNAAPDSYRPLLVEKAGLPDALADSYKVNTYPTHQLPTQAEVDAVLAWMSGKGLLQTKIAYADLVWETSATPTPSDTTTGAGGPPTTTP